MSRAAEENPVNSKEAARQLALPAKPWSHGRMSAIKRAMGLKGRYVWVSEIRKWLRSHPEFRIEQIYPNKARIKVKVTFNQAHPCTPGDRPAAAVDKSGEPSLTHAR